MGPDDVRARKVLLDMMDVLSRDPYEALGLIPSATQADIRNAFLEKTKQFHPAKFARTAPDLQKLANEVFLALRAAHETLARPSTVARGAGPRPLAGSPVRASASGGIPAVRPTGAPPMTSAAPRPGTAPLPASPLRPSPLASPPTGTRPASAQMPAQVRPATPPVAPARPPTQPMSALRTDGVRPGTVPARPGTTTRPPPARPPTGQTPVLQQPAAAAKPAAPVDRELAPIVELMAQNQFPAAKLALETLIARAPQSTKFRAMLAYAKGREAQLDKRVDEARVELQDALQLDPDLQLAKTALGELFSRRR